MIKLFHCICQIHPANFRFSLFYIKQNNKTTFEILMPPQVNRVLLLRFIIMWNKIVFTFCQYQYENSPSLFFDFFNQKELLPNMVTP